MSPSNLYSSEENIIKSSLNNKHHKKAAVYNLTSYEYFLLENYYELVFRKKKKN